MNRSAAILVIQNLTKRYGNENVVDIPFLEVPEGAFFTLVGPSGSGKSTLVGLLTGAVTPTTGTITIHGRDVTHLPADKRPTATVFQSLALFPHLNVGENIEFALRVRGDPKSKRKKRTLELMQQFRLPEWYYDKAVSQCSGGERQRVAIARAIAYDPDILFFDEPLSAVDYRLRKTLQVEVTEIHRTTGKTFIFVTHSIEEAMVMSDRIAIMRDGRVVQIGDPASIYLQPGDPFVADFVGDTNILSVRSCAVEEDGLSLEIDGIEMPLHARVNGTAPGDQVTHLIVRPESIRLLGREECADNVLHGIVERILMLGSRVQFHCRCGSQRIIVEKLFDEVSDLRIGDRVVVGWDARQCVLLYAR
jgi:spermidine/putrescine transport system ATP-binding protein